MATGPSLGSALITAGGWRWAFYVNLPVGGLAWLWGRRILTESRAEGLHGTPDYPGVALVSLSLAGLVLAITEGPSWGWTSARVLGALMAAVVLGAAFLRRSRRHPAPVLDLTLFRARSFTVANTSTLVYAMGFFAMLLGNILFLTGVWHYSILKAGLAVTPGPLVVAIVSGPAGRMAGRVGFRAVLVPGAVLFGAALVWYGWRVGLQPHYLSEWLPGTLVAGLGIGLTFPVFSAAAVSSLSPEHLAVGGAVNQTARQIGGAIGVAILVVIIGNPASRHVALTRFHHLWLYSAVMALLSGLVGSALRPLTSVESEVVEEVASELPAAVASFPIALEAGAE